MSVLSRRLLDGTPERAYSRRVESATPSARTAAATPQTPHLRRRRSATGAEQERRKAWGRKYGALVSANWKAIQKRMGEQ